MAATTVTSAQVAVGPVRSDQPGLNYRYVNFVWGRDVGATSLSVSVCLQLMSIPDGARVIGLKCQVNAPAGTVGAYTIGDGSSTNRYVTKFSLTASQMVTGFGFGGAEATSANDAGFGWRYSTTSSGLTHMYTSFDTIDMTFDANVTSTLTLCVDMAVYYIMDRQNVGEV